METQNVILGATEQEKTISRWSGRVGILVSLVVGVPMILLALGSLLSCGFDSRGFFDCSVVPPVSILISLWSVWVLALSCVALFKPSEGKSRQIRIYIYAVVPVSLLLFLGVFSYSKL